ncbi:MAG: hypothetical protein JWL63_872 [Rhodocyclales bacterium]|nr:hypothetical protein [Rhodocyclales bacterium]
MAFTSFNFLALVTLVVLLTQCFASPLGRSLVLAAGSAVFVASYLTSPLQIVPLAAFLALCYGMVVWVQARPSRAALAISISLVVASFIYLKKFSFLDGIATLPFPYLVIGLSYILFRVIHILVDACQGGLPAKIGLLAFFNYTSNFLAFVSGPIQRFQDYAERCAAPLVLDEEKVFAAFSRAITGFVKLAIVSAVANYFFGSLSAQLFATSDAWPKAVAIYALAASIYTIYLYYNFAGYMDIVIGVSWLIGLDLPENFNKPFSSRNFLEFWSRWHMTLSDWFKLYVFNPLLKSMAMRVESPALQPYLGVIAFFVTFLIMGMWHGTTNVFLVYGLLLGAAASANKFWQINMTKRLGKQRYKALAANPLYAWFCTGLTFAFFALALTCFWTDMAQLQGLVRLLGIGGILAALLAMAVVAGVLLMAGHALTSWLTPRIEGWSNATRGFVARNLLLGTRVLGIAVVASFFHKAPEFVYRAF